MILKIGKRFSLACRDIAEASRFYQAVRNASFEGCSTFPPGEIKTEWAVYRISYNGRVWIGDSLYMEASK